MAGQLGGIFCRGEGLDKENTRTTHVVAPEQTFGGWWCGRRPVCELVSRAIADVAGSRARSDFARPCACFHGHGVVHQSFDLCAYALRCMAQWHHDTRKTGTRRALELYNSKSVNQCRSGLANTAYRNAFLCQRIGGTGIYRNTANLANSCDKPMEKPAIEQKITGFTYNVTSGSTWRNCFL